MLLRGLGLYSTFLSVVARHRMCIPGGSRTLISVNDPAVPAIFATAVIGQSHLNQKLPKTRPTNS